MNTDLAEGRHFHRLLGYALEEADSFDEALAAVELALSEGGAALAQGDWRKTGTVGRGGLPGWRDVRSGEVRYQQSPPQSRQAAPPQTQAPPRRPAGPDAPPKQAAPGAAPAPPAGPRGQAPPPRQPPPAARSSQEAAAEYRQLGTRAPAFKAWFGDWEGDPQAASKVRDEETGEPAVVYHGTPVAGGVEEFGDAYRNALAKEGAGFYFTSYPGIAEKYRGGEGKGSVVKAYLNIRNPVDWEAPVPADKLPALRDLLASHPYEPFRALAASVGPDTTPEGVWDQMAEASGSDYVAHATNQLFRKLGYDGIRSGHAWVAFGPTQIKSADNRGTFDPRQRSINLAAAAPDDPEPGAAEGVTDAHGTGAGVFTQPCDTAPDPPKVGTRTRSPRPRAGTKGGRGRNTGGRKGGRRLPRALRVPRSWRQDAQGLQPLGVGGAPLSLEEHYGTEPPAPGWRLARPGVWVRADA